jgi:hypothetical protein
VADAKAMPRTFWRRTGAPPDALLRRGDAPSWQDHRMDHGYGIESPGEHHHAPHRKPVRYVVLIEEAGSRVARLFLDTREQVGEVDAGAEEVADLLKGHAPARTANDPVWDAALRGNSAAERRAAEVYTLGV